MKKDNTVEAEIVEDTQIVLSEIKYPVSETDLKSLLEEYKDIPNIDPNSEDTDLIATQYQFVRKGHIALVRARTGIEKTRKALKAPALDYGKQVDGIAKEFQAMISGTETALQIQRTLVEENEARKMREAEEAEEARISAIKSKIKAFEALPLLYINSSSSEILAILNPSENPTEEIFEEFFNEAVTTYTNSHSQLRQMYDNKILVENAQAIQDEADVKAKLIQEEEDRKLQAEKDLLAEQQRQFQKDKDEFEAKQRAIQEEADRKQAELEADELMKKQESDKRAKDKQDVKDFNYAKLTAIESLREYSDDIEVLLNAIIANKVAYVKWEM